MNKGIENELKKAKRFNWELNQKSNCKATDGSDAVTAEGLGVSMKYGKATIPDHKNLLYHGIGKKEATEALRINLNSHKFDLLSIGFDYRGKEYHILFERKEGIDFLLQYPFKIEADSTGNGNKLKFRFYFNMAHCKLHKPIKL